MVNVYLKSGNNLEFIAQIEDASKCEESIKNHYDSVDGDGILVYCIISVSSIESFDVSNEIHVSRSNVAQVIKPKE